MPQTEPVRPIDPGAWVAHTAAVRGNIFIPLKKTQILSLYRSTRLELHASTRSNAFTQTNLFIVQ